MEVSGYFSLLVEEDLVSELTKERISKEGALTDLRKKMISLSSYVIDKGRSCKETSLDLRLELKLMVALRWTLSIIGEYIFSGEVSKLQRNITGEISIASF